MKLYYYNEFHNEIVEKIGIKIITSIQTSEFFSSGMILCYCYIDG